MSGELERDYRVGEEIGRGRYGVVSKCHSAVTGQCFAVKTIEKSLVQNDAVDRLCLDNEAKLMQLVSGHPNVLGIVDVYEDDEFLHVVLEYCGSGDLLERITARPVFGESEARRVMVPLMEAIAHCHHRGVAHRDIKSDNILFNNYNELKLADFGSAEYFGNGQLMSGIVGTPYYVAPEVVSGRDYNEKVDVWSAGVVLYIMLAGIPPFYGETAKEIFEAVVRANLRFPRGVFSLVSSEAKDLLRRMICKDVSRRFSAKQVLMHPWMINGGDSEPVTILA
ncbi:Ca2+/calmodulin-dependent protein kinase, EF-Hand protein superfamily [Handroanthus impetiginosus]|uniref:Ca2+/calmodulin-dependent protein kinase, EF-Hand protein superfamily n=1 Tax=Handroanthus impetiginosus TaxID=429701 RepID=A0A2G9HB69_9LAMI|nr:Ca2+/calmodulin-dependent protein kinase, EF-Hand protein superfamily [Handroanthus impetiginosus]